MSWFWHCCTLFKAIPQRADLGDCNKTHSLALRAEYEKASANRDYEFEEEVQCIMNCIVWCWLKFYIGVAILTSIYKGQWKKNWIGQEASWDAGEKSWIRS